jgi:uncharacterized protein YjiK
VNLHSSGFPFFQHQIVSDVSKNKSADLRKIRFKKRLMNIFLKTTLLFCFIFLGCKSDKGNGGKSPVIVHLPPIKSAIAVKQNTSATEYKYDLKNPEHTWKLPKDLLEVSGNTWIDDNHLILIEDSNPLLYLVKTDGKNLDVEKTIPFQKHEKNKVDIEDVTLVNNTVYVIMSQGTLFEIKNRNTKPDVEKLSTSLSGDNNVEGICYDPVTKNLLLACKDKSGIKNADKHTKAVYEFNLQTGKLAEKPFLIIRQDAFKELANDQIDFNPSAIAVHPLSHNIYLLSTRGSKCMAVFNREGKLISFQKIDDDLMDQPEGICFSPGGKLYISSEGKKDDPGKLFEFEERK